MALWRARQPIVSTPPSVTAAPQPPPRPVLASAESLFGLALGAGVVLSSAAEPLTPTVGRPPARATIVSAEAPPSHPGGALASKSSAVPTAQLLIPSLVWSTETPPPFSGTVIVSRVVTLTVAVSVAPGKRLLAQAEAPRPEDGRYYYSAGQPPAIPPDRRPLKPPFAQEEPPPYSGWIASAHAWAVTPTVGRPPPPPEIASAESPPPDPGSTYSAHGLPPAVPPVRLPLQPPVSAESPPPYPGTVHYAHAWALTQSRVPYPARAVLISAEPSRPDPGWALSLIGTPPPVVSTPPPGTLALAVPPPPYPGAVIYTHAWRLTVAPAPPAALKVYVQAEEPRPYAGYQYYTSGKPEALPVPSVVRLRLRARTNTFHFLQASDATFHILQADFTMAILSKFQSFRGEDSIIEFELTPVEDCTGWSITFKAAMAVGETAVYTKVAPIYDGPNGKFRLTITRAESLLLAAGLYQWEARRTDTGNNAVLAAGTWDHLPERAA